MNRPRVATRLTIFTRSLVLLGVIAVGVPWALLFAARQRFGGGSPLAAVEPPSEWRADRIWGALTDRLTDQTIADIVIRLSLVVAWVAVAVIVVTVVAEAAHMVRHDGLAMPDIRGFGMSQRTARVIASGLLVIVPLFTSPSVANARTGSWLLPDQRVAASADAPSFDFGAVAAAERQRTTPDTPATSPRPTDPRSDAIPAARAQSSSAPFAPAPATSFAASADTADAGARSNDRVYVVRGGDSVYGIAERLAGPDQAAINAYAGQLIDINLGRQMPDGRRFTNAAFLDVGWVLELPAVAGDGSIGVAGVPERPSGSYVVEPGDSLWSIADAELGDPRRWPEVFDANTGTVFHDGRTMSDPDLIQPGWELDVPGDQPSTTTDSSDAEQPVEEPAEEPSDAGPATDAGADASPDDGLADVVSSDLPVDDVDGERTVDRVGDDAADRGTGGGSVGDDPSPSAHDSDATAPSSAPRQDNIWAEEVALGPDGSAVVGGPVANRSSQPPAHGGDEPPEPPADGRDTDAPELLTLGRAGMLSAGILTLLAVRRRGQLRRARPRSQLPKPPARVSHTERVLRSIDSGERFSRVDVASRAVALSVVDRDERVLAVLVDTDGALELRTTGPVQLGNPWEGSGSTWHLAAATPLELLAEDARRVAAPCPTLVQLGRDDQGRDAYVDLEAIEAIEIGGPGGSADAIVAAIAATLAASVLAEVTTLVGIGVPDASFLGHRHYVPAGSGAQAFEEAAEAIGSTASMKRSTFDLRARATSGETWEPAVVLAGAAVGAVRPPTDRTGLAVVSASPIHGPSSRLAPDGDTWTLLPLGIRLTPVGLDGADIEALAELVSVIEAVPEPEPSPDHVDVVLLGDDDTLVAYDERPRSVPSPADGAAEDARDVADDVDHVAVAFVVDVQDDQPAVATPLPHYELLVRLMGPVEVVGRDGSPVEFERSKTRELLAWLSTHRERPSRSAARTALWELDVRDATFANVVSEARRSMARLVEPPEGEEWVARTNTDALPLHEWVRTDADVVRHALDSARVQPPAQAIATLVPAIDLIAGIPFAGTTYLWPDSEGITSNLVLLATTATAELAAHCLSVGDIEGVFGATSRGLQVLPGQEELIGLRMEAHARAGDHAGVRQEWESYERVINGDPWSDGEPAPKLVELRRRLLSPSR